MGVSSAQCLTRLKSKVSPGAVVSSGTLLHGHWLLTKFSSLGCRTAVPVFFLAISCVSLSAPRSYLYN